MDMAGARARHLVLHRRRHAAAAPPSCSRTASAAARTTSAQQAEKLARDGYAVLTWSARGFGRSTGKIGLNDPDGEVADVSRLIDWLGEAARGAARRRRATRASASPAPRTAARSRCSPPGTTSGSTRSPRRSPTGTSPTRSSPTASSRSSGPGIFFTSGGGCDRFEPRLCAMYERVAESPGSRTPRPAQLLDERSPVRRRRPHQGAHAASSRARPTPSSRSARPTPWPRRSRANGAPVDVDWIAGGHDGGDRETGRVQARIAAWFDRYLKDDKGADTGPAFRVTRTGGVDSTDGARPAARRDRATATRAWTSGAARRSALDRPRADASPTRPAPARPPSPPCPASAAAARPALLPRRRPLPRLPRPVRRASTPRRCSGDLRITGSPTVRVHVQSTQRRRGPLRQGVRRRRRTARSRCCPPSSSPRSGSRAPRQGKDVDAAPCPPSTTRSTPGTGCAWSSPPPTSATPPRPRPPRTPSRSRARR